MNTVATAVPDVIPLPAALAAVWGAFLFEGLLTSDRDPLFNQQVLESWGQGCIELVIETTACLTELWQQVAIIWNNNDADFFSASLNTKWSLASGNTWDVTC